MVDGLRIKILDSNTLNFFKDAELPVLVNRIPPEIASIHRDIDACGQSLDEGEGRTEIEYAVRTAKSVRNHSPGQHYRLSSHIRSEGGGGAFQDEHAQRGGQQHPDDEAGVEQQDCGPHHGDLDEEFLDPWPGQELGVERAEVVGEALGERLAHGGRDEHGDEDAEAVATLLEKLGAIDVFVLPPHAGDQLIGARERAFFVAKASGVNDIVDVVVPRASIPAYLRRAGDLAQEHASLVTGCGHAGDGNVHLSVFQPDPEIRRELVRSLLESGVEMGGAISGEHGLGRAKAEFFLELGDPVVLALMQRLKQAFDPNGILAPGNLPGLPQ